MSEITINVQDLFGHSALAKLTAMNEYEHKCLQLAGHGTDVVLTGAGPIWLYLRLAHVLHGKARSLWYESPVTGRVKIFNHNPF